MDRFKVVILDFERVTNIGQAFADEIFRVFSSQYPEIDFVAVNTNSGVRAMIAHAKSIGPEPHMPLTGHGPSKRNQLEI